MLDLIDFAMHQLLRCHNLSTKNLTDSLVAEADSKNWHAASETAHNITRDTSFIWGTWTRRYEQVTRLLCSYCITIDGIIPMDLNSHTWLYFTKSLNEIPCKRIVVINEKYHKKNTFIYKTPRYSKSVTGSPTRSTRGITWGL